MKWLALLFAISCGTVGLIQLDNWINMQAWGTGSGSDWLLAATGWQVLTMAWPLMSISATFGFAIAYKIRHIPIGQTSNAHYEKTITYLRAEISAANARANNAKLDAMERVSQQIERAKQQECMAYAERQRAELALKAAQNMHHAAEAKQHQVEMHIQQFHEQLAHVERRRNNAAAVAERRRQRLERLTQAS